MSDLTPRINKIESKTSKNVLINGGMDFFQRNTTFSGAYGYRTADRWNVGATVSTTSERSTDIPSELINKVDYSLKVSPDATVAAGSISSGVVEQWVEGNFAKLLYGKDMRMSFYLKTNKIGTYTFNILSANLSDQSYSSEIEVVDTNWHKYTVLIPHGAANQAAFGTDTGKGFICTLTLLAGTDFQTSSLDQWIVGNKFASTNQVNFYDSTANELYFTGAMLTEDTGADFDFERSGKDFTEELQLCQRYYEQNYFYQATYQGAVQDSFFIRYNIPKRVISVVTRTNSVDILSHSSVRIEGFSILVTGGGTEKNPRCDYQVDAEL